MPGIIGGMPLGWGVFICFGMLGTLGMLLDTSRAGQLSSRRYISAMGFLALGCFGQALAGYPHFAVVTLVLGIVLLARAGAT